jgi:hypothetical protein
LRAFPVGALPLSSRGQFLAKKQFAVANELNVYLIKQPLPMQDKMHKIYIVFSSFAFSAMALVAGCMATTGKPEVIAEKQSPPDAWDNRLEKIMDDKEIISTQNKEEAETISLEQQYKSEQTQLTDAFAECFAKVFAGRTFDGGVPWKSEGQGYRNIISVNGEGVAMWWTISRRSRSCSPLPRFQERCHPFRPYTRGLEDMTNASLQRGRQG